MSNETDLDWLARNVHEWPAGDHQHWCYVYWKGGHRAVSANCITVIQPCVRIDKAEWIALRSELQNKPSWADAPEWAQWLGQIESGNWEWYGGEEAPSVHESGDCWLHKAGGKPSGVGGEVLGDWRDTLEKRPEQDEFETFTSIEDNQGQDMAQQQEMKQDNGWFERGELPPVGASCEALITSEHQWVEIEVICHRDGFALGWCPKERCGYHGDEPTDFRPILTERDKLVELIKTYRHTFRSDTEFADAILSAGFKRGEA